MTKLPAGYTLHTFDEIDSTNEEARRNVSCLADGLTHVFWAKSQTAGRGRRARPWTSAPGNLFVSLLLEPGSDLATSAQLSFLSALTIADTVDELIDGFIVGLKWPNDVLINGSKVSGILLESSSTGKSAADALIIGMGINITSHPEDTPYPATDLKSLGANPPDAEAILERLLENFKDRYQAWQSHGFTGVRQDWLARAHNLGGKIEVRLDRETLTGIFTDLDADGALVLQTPDGKTQRINAGDVFYP